MIPDPEVNIWEHTRSTLFDLYAKRARNELTEMTCHKQAVDLIEPHYQPGMSVLDAGCGSGYFFRSFQNRGLDVEYHGIDYTGSFIDIGRQNIPESELPRGRLRHEAIEQAEGAYDAVFCINTLFCLPNYRQGLERLAEAAQKFLIIRTTLADETQIRYETDDYLDEGYGGPDGLRSYFNIWALGEFTDYLDELGFDAALVTDERTSDKGEISAGKFFPWRVLFCQRINKAG